ncbi:MAG: hypothetical protein GF329_17610 [Candidatus Lokiarchaeota archaeon]|nr:hypothetical protein [Candidatus Lokiarchaeota archaeon]
MSDIDKKDIISEIEKRSKSEEENTQNRVISKVKDIEGKIEDIYNGEIDYIKNKCFEYEDSIKKTCDKYFED